MTLPTRQGLSSLIRSFHTDICDGSRLAYLPPGSSLKSRLPAAGLCPASTKTWRAPSIHPLLRSGSKRSMELFCPSPHVNEAQPARINVGVAEP